MHMDIWSWAVLKLLSNIVNPGSAGVACCDLVKAALGSREFRGFRTSLVDFRGQNTEIYRSTHPYAGVKDALRRPQEQLYACSGSCRNMRVSER